MALRCVINNNPGHPGASISPGWNIHTTVTNHLPLGFLLLRPLSATTLLFSPVKNQRSWSLLSSFTSVAAIRSGDKPERPFSELFSKTRSLLIVIAPQLLYIEWNKRYGYPLVISISRICLRDLHPVLLDLFPLNSQYIV